MVFGADFRCSLPAGGRLVWSVGPVRPPGCSGGAPGPRGDQAPPTPEGAAHRAELKTGRGAIRFVAPRRLCSYQRFWPPSGVCAPSRRLRVRVVPLVRFVAASRSRALPAAAFPPWDCGTVARPHTAACARLMAAVAPPQRQVFLSLSGDRQGLCGERLGNCLGRA